MPKRVQRIKDSESKRKKISEKLKQKANNPKDLSLREFVESLKQQISEVIDAGYDYSEIAKIMKDEGIEVAPSTIRSYLNTKKDNKTINSKKKNHQATSEEISNNDLTEDSTTINNVASEEISNNDLTENSTTINDVIEEEISKTDDSDSRLTL